MKYRMEDEVVVDTDQATEEWDEERDWNGSNHIGRSSGSQWHSQTLYRSRKGRYYLEHTSGVQGERSHAEWVSNKEAVRWLTLNEHALPEDLQALADEATE